MSAQPESLAHIHRPTVDHTHLHADVSLSSPFPSALAHSSRHDSIHRVAVRTWPRARSFSLPFPLHARFCLQRRTGRCRRRTASTCGRQATRQNPDAQRKRKALVGSVHHVSSRSKSTLRSVASPELQWWSADARVGPTRGATHVDGGDGKQQSREGKTRKKRCGARADRHGALSSKKGKRLAGSGLGAWPHTGKAICTGPHAHQHTSQACSNLDQLSHALARNSANPTNER